MSSKREMHEETFHGGAEEPGLTRDQLIRTSAAKILFEASDGIEVGLFLQDDGVNQWEIGLEHRNHLRALERYIRDGLGEA